MGGGAGLGGAGTHTLQEGEVWVNPFEGLLGVTQPNDSESVVAVGASTTEILELVCCLLWSATMCMRCAILCSVYCALVLGYAPNTCGLVGPLPN